MDRRSIFFLTIVLTVIVLAVFVARKIDKRGGVPAVKKADTAVPAAVEKSTPVVALVLDDFGYTRRNLEALRKIDVPVTLAVLPNVPYTHKVCAFAGKNGQEVILHLPMEPESGEAHLEQDTIRADMDDASVRRIIARDLDSVSSAKGASNHMGSKATKNRRLMKVVLGDLKERNMFFLDSLTTRESECGRVARELDIPYAKRDIFIDNELDPGHIRKQMEKLERLALANGKALAIGHDRAVTIEVLREVVPKMSEKGIRFVTLSDYIGSEKTGGE
ncbi:MAG: divergent polysaccharide deacetylase family protein [Candidatus Omnitrophota bacterium]|nr:divergent polysaccharide deacetylase family protein [Candidatus Omnitrophota bacterium]